MSIRNLMRDAAAKRAPQPTMVTIELPRKLVKQYLTAPYSGASFPVHDALRAALSHLQSEDGPLGSVQGGGEEERCRGTGDISRPNDSHCDCIMTAHCHGNGGKNGKACRLRRYGSGTEGSPGVASAPRITTKCPGCPDCALTQPASTEGDLRERLLSNEGLAAMLDSLGQRGWYTGVVARAKEDLRNALCAALATQEEND